VDIPYAWGPSRPDLALDPARRTFVTRLGLLLVSAVAGAALAFAVAFTATSVLASSNESPVNQQLYNYGTK
jgi:uncharacterized protein involved in exopolysaccharide biosynthesis